MLDQDEVDAPAPAPDEPDGRGQAKTITVVSSVVGTAILLSVFYFPAFFKPVEVYDDEGSFLLVIRQFMHHGSLYVHTHSSYGPFYFSLTSLILAVVGFAMDGTPATCSKGRKSSHRRLFVKLNRDLSLIHI